MKPMDPRLARFWGYMPEELTSELSADQRIAINDAIVRANPVHPGPDIRLSFGPFFLRVLAGRERRSRERLIDERRKHPVFTRRNLPLLGITWGISIAAVYLVVLMFQRTMMVLATS